MTLNKEIKYLALAEHFAQIFSKDKSTQVGALFLHPTEFTILSAGYNGMPRGCNDDAPERSERPLKYLVTEHAERNAIYNAVRSVFRGSKVVCTTSVDMDDIRAIVSVGVSTLAIAQLPAESVAEQLLMEAGVTLVPVPENAAPNQVVFLAKDSQNVLAQASEVVNAQPAEDSAVRRAIFEAARPMLADSTVVVAPLPPCAACARALAAVGTTRVISHRPTEEQNARWGESFQQSRQLFAARGIELIET
jgi:dCMP deaminase